MMKKVFARFLQPLGFQIPPSNNLKVQPFSKAENTENADDSENVRSSDPTEPYDSWLEEHPSALQSFEQMMKIAKEKEVVVFLDYDGTLSPIVDDPEKAFMSDEMRGAVREVAKYFPTAIISGRSRDKVKEFVKLSNVYYAGSHGMDIMAPPRPVKSSSEGKLHILACDKKGSEVVFQPAAKYLPAIQEMIMLLKEAIRKIPGAKVEDNRFCISVHYRKCQEKYALVEEKVKSVLEKYPGFHLGHGKMVLEIRPSIQWDKGNAVEYFLETFGLSDSTDVLALYIGDDRTDEDAFEVIQHKGQGFPIIVSSIPKDTKASYSLLDPPEVLDFLLRLAKWRKSSSSIV